MSKWFNKIFGSKNQSSAPQWRTDDSIFLFLSRNVGPDGKLTSEASDLPDEKREENKLRYAPGLMDALFQSDDSETLNQRAEILLDLLEKLTTETGEQAKISEYEFYNEIVSNPDVISVLDRFLEGVLQRRPSVERFAQFAQDLTLKSNHRNAVKFGIAMSGICQNVALVEPLKILGLHNEFTLFTVVALARLLENPLDDLWELAKKVDGWGKVQLVLRFAELELPEQVKDWLVREGYKNNILYEYLAYTCAVHGELHLRLASETIDDGLFRSAGEIMDALCSEGPGESLSDYQDAASAVQDYVRHAKTHTADDLFDFLVLHKLNDALTEINKDIDSANNGWTRENVADCLIDINIILRDEKWKEKTLYALEEVEESPEYWHAKQAARRLNIDLQDTASEKMEIPSPEGV